MKPNSSRRSILAGSTSQATSYTKAPRYVLVGLLLALSSACSLLSRKDHEAAPVASAAASVAIPAATATSSAALAAAAPAPSNPIPEQAKSLTDYSQEGLAALPEDCVDPAVVLLAVPKDYYAKDSFDWRHARQVALANPEFSIVSNLAGGGSGERISFTENEHKPSGGVALVAHCSTAKGCMRFAAAYRAVVATAKPTPICGKNPNVGARISGGKSVLPESGRIADVLPTKQDVQSQCVRLAACKAARDHQLASDESQACIMKPGSFKPSCATKKSCEQVLACVDG